MSRVRVLVCDDHADFRRGLRALLDTSAEVEVVGEAVDGEEVAALSQDLQPDVVLMDLNMPGTGGVAATRQITGRSPHIGVIVLSMVEDDDAVFASMQAGARGYLLKGARKADIVRAITSVADGDAIFGPGIARRLMRYFDRGPAPSSAQSFPELTARELEILRLMAGHLTNPEIADRLSLSPKTVRNNVSTIFNKLQVADRAQAIITARRAGLGAPGQ